MNMLNRLLLLGAGALAAYQVAAGVEGLPALALSAYTVAFGVLLVADLLLMILGFEVLESPVVIIVASIIPLGLAVGLVAQYLPEARFISLALAGVGLLIVVFTRYFWKGRSASLMLSVVHGAAGLLIFSLPLILSFTGRTSPGFALVGIGGALIGIGGLLLFLLKAGHPILSHNTIRAVFPGLLLLTTATFVSGFWLA